MFVYLNKLKSPAMLIVGLFFVLNTHRSFSQNTFSPSDTLNKKRLNFVRYAGIGGTTAVLGGLSYLWYSDYEPVSFHFFDDSKEWLMMDKVGHSVSAYYGGFYGYKSLKWAGLSERKSTIYGGLYGWTFLLGTEFLDGISSGWGASPTDLLANSLGASMFIGQQLVWKEQRVLLKFSYWPSEYAQYRPEKLGDSHWNRWLKDYNGQTYWLSANIYSFLKEESKFPKWINIAFGYSGDGMLGGADNPSINEAGELLPVFDRRREYFLSLDVDFRKIKTKNKILRTILYTASFVKIPFPSIGYSNNKLKFHYLHY